MHAHTSPTLHRLSTYVVSFVCLACLADAAWGQAPRQNPRSPRNSAFAQIEDEPNLPRVLLLGDSISIGYTLAVRAELKGEANVHRPPENCQSTAFGLERLDAWLGDKPWDVIHFNFGLHDLKYIDEQRRLVDVAVGKQQVPIDEYRKNLEAIVERLEKTGASLIWCSTTPVPENSLGRVKGDAARYNAVAAEIMKKHGIPIDDLYQFVIDEKIPPVRPGNVHFSAESSQKLAKHVADSIRRALAERKAKQAAK
ncbi:MAG: SGNH/GDSL hydrolase family protein [Planctomycetota bacterium]|nr:MAG: SGNH/GDSL hydrolase family protein [Planctomycetota bacterium]